MRRITREVSLLFYYHHNEEINEVPRESSQLAENEDEDTECEIVFH